MLTVTCAHWSGAWTEEHQEEVAQARTAYDTRAAEGSEATAS